MKTVMFYLKTIYGHYKRLFFKHVLHKELKIEALELNIGEDIDIQEKLG